MKRYEVHYHHLAYHDDHGHEQRRRAKYIRAQSHWEAANLALESGWWKGRQSLAVRCGGDMRYFEDVRGVAEEIEME